MDLTTSQAGIACLVIFAVAYAFVVCEDATRLRKSVPVVIAAGAIWILVALAYTQAGNADAARAALEHNVLEFAELFLFLLSAVTFVNTMEELQVFDALRGWLVGRAFTLRALYWITGLLAFVLSPFLDNLTTALVMGAVAIAIAGGNARFVTVACVNIVVAANAGGAFSPFGDITTLMVWQKGVVKFTEFFALFVPSAVNWLVPAAIMMFAVPRERPSGASRSISMRPGARAVMSLFALTILGTVVAHSVLHVPPVLGMMTGLGLLNLYGYWRGRSAPAAPAGTDEQAVLSGGFHGPVDKTDTFDLFGILQRIEWDTFMFFYGVILCVGGLGALGYLAVMSRTMYDGLGPTWANVVVGLASAIVDNIPIMFAVLSMHPDMSHNQWLLVTLTAGVGGSLLSIGSAAGVALMGQARDQYTFRSHLRWSWAVALGYAASILAHLAINGT